jgi:hypothetical protein
MVTLVAWVVERYQEEVLVGLLYVEKPKAILWAGGSVVWKDYEVTEVAAVQGRWALYRRLWRRYVSFRLTHIPQQLTKTQDVLYLVIVDMPSEDELAAAQGIATELMDGEERNWSNHVYLESI